MNDDQNNFNSNQNNEKYVDCIQRDVEKENIPKMEFESVHQETPRKKSGFRKSAAKLVASAAIFGMIAGVGYQGVNFVANGGFSNYTTGSNSDTANAESMTSDDDSTSAIQTSNTSSSSSESGSGVSEIVENVMPSIVAITSTIEEVSYDIFGQPQVEEASGAGSGIIIGESDEADEIYIATNNHVIEDATTIVIQFCNDVTITGTVKGADSSSDLAVVAVKLSDLDDDTISQIKVATLGNSDNTKEGELVVAIGNALGYGQSVTVGYVSALNREVTVDDDTTLTLLQTDAAINPGNSGGALLNSVGEVIGINSVKYVETEVEGIGYAIPITTAIPILEELMNREIISESEQGYLGIGGEDVTDSYSTALGLPVGVYINTVEEGSAADEAGLVVGDVITGIGSRTISTMDELKEYLTYTKAGSSVTVTYEERVDGVYTEKTVEVTLGSKN